MSVSPDTRLVLRHALAVFGTEGSVQRYDERGEAARQVDILSCPDAPAAGLVSYSTIGLSEHAMRVDGQEHAARLELAGVSTARFPEFAGVLATAALSILRSGQLYRPGSVVENAVKEYDPGTAVPHVVLLRPLLWGGRLTGLACGGRLVAWLQVVPVSESELTLVQELGVDALGELLVSGRVDIADPARCPVR